MVKYLLENRPGKINSCEQTMTEYRVYIETAWAQTVSAKDKDQAEKEAIEIWIDDYNMDHTEENYNILKASAKITVVYKISEETEK